MWGSIVLENINNYKFNTSFADLKSCYLLQLAQWQYWWWFWFAFLWCFYFFVILKLIKTNSIKFFSKINTSVRSHGKWGDFLIGIIPISWCLNILVNSNFLLKLIEWQTETSLLTLRVRAKQWYWVYKLDSNNLVKLSYNNKNLGFSKWVTATELTNNKLTELMHELKLEYLLKNTKNFWENMNPIKKLTGVQITPSSYVNYNIFLFTSKNIINNYHWGVKITPIEDFISTVNQSNYFRGYQKLNINKTVINFCQETKNKLFTMLFSSETVENYNQRSGGFYYLIKQQKYSRYQKYTITQTSQELQKSTTLYSLFERSRRSNKQLEVSLLPRLLRVQTLLILPTQLNISVITNSYDIIHSWFIPGLGLKLDCVPGRSTHHTLYIVTSGFYYGQCAEICGRYHHHMPIKVCAVSYDQFLIWWLNIGLKNYLIKK